MLTISPLSLTVFFPPISRAFLFSYYHYIILLSICAGVFIQPQRESVSELISLYLSSDMCLWVQSDTSVISLFGQDYYPHMVDTRILPPPVANTAALHHIVQIIYQQRPFGSRAPALAWEIPFSPHYSRFRITIAGNL